MPHLPGTLGKTADGWMDQAYSRLSTTHGHITDCKLVCMYLTRLVLVRPAASLYSAIAITDVAYVRYQEWKSLPSLADPAVL